MPTYTAKCEVCGHEQDYIARVQDRENTPICQVCEGDMYKIVTATMVTAMGIADNYQVVSPIDGKTLYGRSQYYAHMKEHNVVPMSEMQGQAEHAQKQIAADEAKQRKQSIERTVNTMTKK